MTPGFQIGPIPIRFYGIILMIGALAGTWLAGREARRRKFDSELVWDALIWVLVGGIIGARLWHIFTPPPSMVAQGFTVRFYLTHPLDILAVWNGGLGIPGAIIGGLVALYFYTRRHKLNFLVWADIGAPGLALGQAIGRWGNYVNQELYGFPSNLPWAITIDPNHRLPGYENIARYHPLFLYESIWDLMNMAFLLWIGRRHEKRLLNGDIFLIYLIVYPTGRFFLEFLRLDPAQVAGINFNQTVMAVVALSAAFILFARHRIPSREMQPAPEAPADPDEATPSTEIEETSGTGDANEAAEDGQ